MPHLRLPSKLLKHIYSVFEIPITGQPRVQGLIESILKPPRRITDTDYTEIKKLVTKSTKERHVKNMQDIYNIQDDINEILTKRNNKGI